MKLRNASCLLGLALFLVFSASGFTPETAPPEQEVFLNPESLVRGLYAAVSFGQGKPADWSYVRKFFLPEAVIVVRKTRTAMEVQNVDMFIQWFEDDAKKFKMDEKGFEETIEKLKLTVFGDTAQCFVVYKARLKTPPETPGQIGLDSWALMKKDERWWVVSVTNDVVTPQRPLPEELR
jgi:ketosteroid isomerase-like protein